MATIEIDLGSVIGPPGEKGADGTRGSRITTGTAVTGTSATATVFATGITDALVNDLYLNTSTGNVYQCTVAGNASTAKWKYVGCIKGQIGATGKTGAAGADGKDGVGIKSVEQTTTSSVDGGSNVITATLTDGTTATFTVKNGGKGSTGATGKTGATGADGERGTGILKITTAPSAYTTVTNGITPAYRIALSTVTAQSGVASVLVGDILEYSYYHYPVVMVDTSYVYLGTRSNIRGATGATGGTGATGADGADGKDGEDGNSIWSTTTAPSTSGTTYTFTTSKLTGGTNAPKVGDVILYSYYRYTVTSVTSTTAVCANTRVSLRGATGAKGADGADGTKIYVQETTPTGIEAGTVWLAT